MIFELIPPILLRVRQQACCSPDQPGESTHLFEFAMQSAFGMQERDIVGTANRDKVEEDVGDGSAVGETL